MSQHPKSQRPTGSVIVVTQLLILYRQRELAGYVIASARREILRGRLHAAAKAPAVLTET